MNSNLMLMDDTNTTTWENPEDCYILELATRTIVYEGDLLDCFDFANNEDYAWNKYKIKRYSNDEV